MTDQLHQTKEMNFNSKATNKESRKEVPSSSSRKFSGPGRPLSVPMGSNSHSYIRGPFSRRFSQSPLLRDDYPVHRLSVQPIFGRLSRIKNISGNFTPTRHSLLVHNEFSMYRKLLTPVVVKKKFDSKAVTNYYFQNLSHPNYRMLDWGPIVHKPVRSHSGRPTKLSVTSSRVLTPDPLQLDEVEVKKVYSQHKTKNAINFCHGLNRANRFSIDVFRIRENLRELTGSPFAILNDYRYARKIKNKLLRKMKQDITMEIPSRKGDIEGEDIPTADRARPHSVDCINKSIYGNYPFLSTRSKSHSKSLAKRKKYAKHFVRSTSKQKFEEEIEHKAVLNKKASKLAVKGEDKAMEELYMQKGNETVSQVLSKHLPETKNEIETMFNLATMAIEATRRSPIKPRKLKKV